MRIQMFVCSYLKCDSTAQFLSAIANIQKFEGLLLLAYRVEYCSGLHCQQNQYRHYRGKKIWVVPITVGLPRIAAVLPLYRLLRSCPQSGDGA